MGRKPISVRNGLKRQKLHQEVKHRHEVLQHKGPGEQQVHQLCGSLSDCAHIRTKQSLTEIIFLANFHVSNFTRGTVMGRKPISVLNGLKWQKHCQEVQHCHEVLQCKGASQRPGEQQVHQLCGSLSDCAHIRTKRSLTKIIFFGKFSRVQLHQGHSYGPKTNISLKWPKTTKTSSDCAQYQS